MSSLAPHPASNQSDRSAAPATWLATVLPARLRPASVAVLASLCAFAGLLTIWDSVRALWGIWLTDDLKSMGMVVPLVSYLLILRAWRQIGWKTRSSDGHSGNWCGFVVLAISAALMFARYQMLLIVTVNKDWLLQLPPLPLVAVLYAAGLVYLFGGWQLLRAAWFPVLFMWAVIPVPQTFSHRVDLPLQHASAHVARAFAHALGQQLTQDKLRLMFTPDFGMFIAPGCNGIRGAITLGMAALVVGYLYRFRWQLWLPLVAGAVTLGYLFNFLRLCLLVIYYKLALPYPWMQDQARNADYVIGGCLFLGALTIFFTVANRLRRPPPAPEPPVTLQPASTFVFQVAAVLALSAVFGLEVAHQYRMESAQAKAAQTIPPLPAKVGNYTLVRTWNDTLLDGIVVYIWGEYAPPATPGQEALHINLGISPQMSVHDAEICHIARGEDPTWHGQISASSRSGPIDLTAATYNDGHDQKLEVSTVCDNGACRQFSETGRHVTLIYAHPHRGLPLEADSARPVPVLLQVQTTDVLAPPTVAEPRLAEAMTRFLSEIDLVALTKPYSQR
jgi:exosortase J